jgi:hypothetical protein
MKHTLFIISFCATCVVSAQTSTDTLTTSIGEFAVESEEELTESTVYVDESYYTPDGGSAEFVSAVSSARFITPQADAHDMHIQVKPNPTIESADLVVDGISGMATIIVTNVLGQVVFTSLVTVDRSQTVQLPAQLWEPGVYMIVVASGGNTLTERLIVE